MDITISSSLTPREKDKIFLLLDACYKKEPVSLTFPTEEADHYLLAWENGRLLCAAALLKEDETIYECTAFTRPDCRRNGIFGAVLEKGLSLLPEDTELLFYVDKKSPDALEAVTALGAELLSDEHMMELASDAVSAIKGMGKTGDLTVTEAMEGEQAILVFSDAHGSLNISLYGTHYYLYGFEIREGQRGQGFGISLLIKVLSFLAEREPLPVTLQVSGSNGPALSLYKKTGFRITETLSRYLY